MVHIKNISGMRKHIFNLSLKLWIVFYFIGYLYKGRLSFHGYFAFLKRMAYFFKKLQHNKFTRVGNSTRLGLYIPRFPSEAFITACDKFTLFNDKLPCITVLISITSACRFKCPHCYQRNDRGKDMPIEPLVAAVKRLQDMGVAFFNIEGGDPFLVYDRLRQVCAAIDNRSEIWINSTGDGMTKKRLLELKDLNLTAVMFSLHAPDPDELNAFMGRSNAWQTMEDGINLCHQADIPVAINFCLAKEDFYNGTFEALMERARNFNAAIMQLIKPKPAGGWLETGADLFSQEDLLHVKKLVHTYNLDKSYQKYPAISAQIIEEDATLYGCTSGATDRFYINAKGDVQPCEFLNISFGNILHEDFDQIYMRMRTQFKTPGTCWLCEQYANDIRTIFKREKLKSLPLNKELSMEVYQKWDRGEPTALYQRIEEVYR
jgi:MoaA/NifB/PqqE/SkfB family radical SAM enzyme